ncbi:MAG: hypothetical protein HN919_08535 [Verrucomicrobia bacterium]|nr:hypothetical protein [Verrucomicrobiota bacterium]MBT7066333.1 hypothetical protein [Verrucomicrobiota bacterium]MBT7701794.1 hypothetical protein [Verrucomicrobiota bacterium]
MRKPVQVFILLGQSNMLGFGKVAGGEGSLDNAVKNKQLYPYLVDDAGNWTVRQDVRNVRVMCSGSGPWKTYKNEWMTISGKHIGPEVGIGHYVGRVLDEPVLILKSCIGNRSLGYDLLPPSADGYEGDKGDPTRTPKPGGWYAGVQYDGDTRAAKEVLEDLSTYYPGAKTFEVAGFCFWQGAKDLGRGGNADKYEENLVHFIKDLRKDFNAPDALFVCATMGQAQKGSGGAGGTITDAQLAVDGKSGKHPEFKGNVATFYSNPVSKPGSANGHYGGNSETYMNVGEGMGRAMAEMLEESRGGGGRKSATSRTAAPPLRKARGVSPMKIQLLNHTMMKALVKVSDAGLLRTGKAVPLSLTRAKVSLVSVEDANSLTFSAGSGKSVAIRSTDLKPVDFANLAVLVTQLKPDNRDARALAGVYLESLGRVDLADKYFGDAGPESTSKMESFFAP